MSECRDRDPVQIAVEQAEQLDFFKFSSTDPFDADAVVILKRPPEVVARGYLSLLRHSSALSFDYCWSEDGNLRVFISRFSGGDAR